MNEPNIVQIISCKALENPLSIAYTTYVYIGKDETSDTNPTQ